MPLPRAEVARYRTALRNVDTLARRDLLESWRSLDTGDAESVRDALMDLLPGIVARYHLVAATVAADWYDLMRAEAGVSRRRFTAIIADQPARARVQVLARWGVGPLFAVEPAFDVALSKLSGGLQRVVTDGARDTITVSSVRDPAAAGWSWVGAGGCDYCRERIGIRITNSTVFSSHDSCLCVSVPNF